MYDNTVHRKTLARHFQEADFVRDRMLFDEAYRQQIVDQAIGIGENGFATLALKKSLLRGKSVYQLSDTADLLVVRHLTANIRRITNVKQDNRKFIVDCIRTLVSDGLAFRVFKYDIKSFYESVLSQNILSRLSQDVAFSGQSGRALTSFFARLELLGISGLPRGLAISATLAEYLMRDFDEIISNHQSIWYYSRFVDDIMCICPIDIPIESIHEATLGALPNGLRFNKKSETFSFVLKQSPSKSSPVSPDGVFDFLGYRFHVTGAWRRQDSKILRSVSIDIAPSKVRRLKSRIIKSVLQYRTDGKYADLLARIKLLTSNYKFVDRKTGAPRVVGIYFNYPHVDPDLSEALRNLDAFLRNLIMSRHAGNKLRPMVTPNQRSELVRLTFLSGFKDKRFYHFKPQRLAQLRSCWAYA